MTTPFDWIKNVSEKSEMDLSLINEYTPFMVNRGLSYFQDTIFFINEMNKYYSLDKDIQHKFLFNTLTKRKRFSKWAKKETSINLDAIIEYYNVTHTKAKEISKILTTDQIEYIIKKLNKGGRK